MTYGNVADGSGTIKEGCGGLGEQIPYQGLGPDSIYERIKKFVQ